MNYWKIKQCIRKKLESNNEKISDRAEARTIGMSQRGYTAMMQNETMSVKKLEELAILFNKSVSYFFTKDENESSQTPEKCEEKDKELEEKDAEILQLKLRLCETQEKYTVLLEELNEKRKKQEKCG